jgi:4-amino-4-deoxy-L-arabinose transferase-like glycosyltransferase
MKVSWILLLGVAVRVGIAAAAFRLRGTSAFMMPDSYGYLELATNIGALAGFRSASGYPELFRTPGYPLMLLPGVLVGHPIVFALAVQLLICAAIILVTIAIARCVFPDDRMALLCGLCVALEPTLILWSLKVMPETLLTLCLVLFIWAVVHAMNGRGWPWVVAAAVCISAAAYVKPIAYPLVLLLVVATPLLGSRRQHLGRMLGGFVLMCGILLGAWHIRNISVASYYGFSTLFEHAMYFSAGAGVAARHEGTPYREVRKRFDTQLISLREDNPNRYAEMRRIGWSLMADQPVEAARLQLQGALRTAIDPGTVEFLRLFGWYPEFGGATQSTVDRGLISTVRGLAHDYPMLLWTSIAVEPMLVAMCVLPLIAASRAESRSSVFVIMGIVVLYLLLAGGGVPGSSRFRSPASPLMVLMSAFACKRQTVTGLYS